MRAVMEPLLQLRPGEVQRTEVIVKRQHAFQIAAREGTWGQVDMRGGVGDRRGLLRGHCGKQWQAFMGGALQQIMGGITLQLGQQSGDGIGGQLGKVGSQRRGKRAEWLVQRGLTPSDVGGGKLV